MKKYINKNIVYIVLIIGLIIALTYVIIYRNTGEKNQREFTENMVKVQKEISFYLGKTNAETFNVYSNLQILSGVIDIANSDQTKIKDNQDVAITPLIDINNANMIKTGETESYLVLNENIKTVLKVDLKEYSGVKYYIQDGNILKVKLDNKPDWWDSSLDCFIAGN